VRFLGHRSGDELVRLFHIADAVCVPSRNEPFGIVVSEAWNAGKPVIASQNGGPGEFVRHEVTGLRIYPASDSVACGLSRMFSNFDWARWMGHNDREMVEGRFTWEMISVDTLAVCRQLCPRVAPCPQEKSAETGPITNVVLCRKDLRYKSPFLSMKRRERL